MQEDPKGYYKILNVSPSASDDEIKIAYRNLAKRLHPDLNPGVDTTAIFQKVNEAYSVLSDPIQRAKYSKRSDTKQNYSYSTSYQKEHTRPKESVLEPYRCSACNCVSHKLRHVKYNQVVSFIFGSNTTTIWGIFCEQCAADKIRKASLITGAFGWMSVPGVFHTAFALGRNLTGGRQENSINMEICARQALYYHQLGQKDKAVSAAFDSIEFANSIVWSSESKQRAEELKPILDSILKSNASSEENRSYQNSYSKSNSSEFKENKYSKNKSSAENKSDDLDSGIALKRVVTFIASLAILVFVINGLNSIDKSDKNKEVYLNQIQNDSMRYERDAVNNIENKNNVEISGPTIDYRHIFNRDGFCIKCGFEVGYLSRNKIYCSNDKYVENKKSDHQVIQITNTNEPAEFRIAITNNPVATNEFSVTNSVEAKKNSVKTNLNSNRGFNFNKNEHRGPTLRKLKQN
jgi:curved DNA-binding protein CbpA